MFPSFQKDLQKRRHLKKVNMAQRGRTGTMVPSEEKEDDLDLAGLDQVETIWGKRQLVFIPVKFWHGPRGRKWGIWFEEAIWHATRQKSNPIFQAEGIFFAKIWGNIGLLFSVQGRSKVHQRNVQTQSSSSTEDQGFSSVDSFPVNSIESQCLDKDDSLEGSSLPASNSCNSSEGQHTPTNYSDAREPSTKSRKSDTSGIDLVSMVVDLPKVQLFPDTCSNRWA